MTAKIIEIVPDPENDTKVLITYEHTCPQRVGERGQTVFTLALGNRSWGRVHSFCNCDIEVPEEEWAGWQRTYKILQRVQKTEA